MSYGVDGRHDYNILHQHLSPLWDGIGVAFNDGTIGKPEEQTCFATIDRIVVDIDTVSDTGSNLTIDDLDIDESIQSIFKNSEIVKVQETDKVGDEQINENMDGK